jgi:hypothetical protein
MKAQAQERAEEKKASRRIRSKKLIVSFFKKIGSPNIKTQIAYVPQLEFHISKDSSQEIG